MLMSAPMLGDVRRAHFHGKEARMPSTTATRWITTPESMSDQLVQTYRGQGFVHIPGVISKEEAARFREAALELARQRSGQSRDGRPFTQMVNVWREDDTMKELTLHPNVAAVAARLAGVPLRLWHDHILIKEQQKNVPTEYHQDQPFWPHANSEHSLSAWIALCDVPVERGCMSFFPGSQQRTDLPTQSTTQATVFDFWPDLVWSPRVTVPLRAGDCTFHHSRCVHGAGSNTTEEPRVAHVVIFMDAGTTYVAKRHPVTDPLQPVEGERLEGDMFPPVGPQSR
jgi:phytanoyl-CoA hydroxylase